MNASDVRRGIPFVVAAPSGTGKTTVCRAVLEREPRLRISVSHTTRKPREGEVDGEHYHFVDEPQFAALVAHDGFLEHAEYAGNHYGTSWKSLNAPLDEGLDLLIEIEVQGAAQVRERINDAKFIFLLPPSFRVLEDRLRGRGTNSDAEVARRLAAAEGEIDRSDIFDYAVVNDDLESTIQSVVEIIHAERERDTRSVKARFDRAAVVSAWLRAEAGGDRD